MAYPKKCPACQRPYTGQGNLPLPGHVTLARAAGGTPSPWRPGEPGQVLTIGCKLCGAIYRWDFFAPATKTRLGRLLELLRPPVPDWPLGEAPSLSGPGPARR